MNHGSEYRRNLASQALGRVLYVAGGAAAFIAATHIMSIDDFAGYALAMTILAVVWTMADLGTTAALASVLGGDAAEDRGATLGAFVVARIGLAMVAGAGGAVASILLLPQSVLTVTLVACLMTPLLAARFFEPVFQVADRPWHSASLGIVYVAVLTPTMVIALSRFPDRPDLLVGAHLVAGGAYAIGGLVLSRRLLGLRFRLDAERIMPLLAVAIPIGLSGLLATLSLRVGVVALQIDGDTQGVANFLGAQRFLELGAAVAVTFCTPLFAIFKRHALASTTSAATRATFAGAAIIGLPILLLAPSLARPVVGLLYGPDLAGTAVLLPIVAAQYCVFILGLAIMPAVVASRRPSVIVIGAAASLALNLVLCAVLVPRYGAVGAAWSALFSEFLIVGVPLAYVWRQYGPPLKGRDVATLVTCGLALGLALHAPSPFPDWPRALVALRGILSLAVFVAMLWAMGVLRVPGWASRQKMAQ